MRKALEHSPTKEKLMDAAQGLILERGFVGTSVDDICKCAKVTKGSFFHYFKSKDDLGLKLLMRYCEVGGKRFTDCCCPTGEKDPLKRVYSLIDMMTQRAKDMGHGCLLGCMSQELSDSNEGIRSMADNAFSQMGKWIAKDLSEAKKLYAPKATFKPQELGEYLVSLMQGGALLAKVSRKPSIATANFSHFRQYLKTLYGR
jgi:TetR/AcrR family transcriptional repressor of nem operon